MADHEHHATDYIEAGGNPLAARLYGRAMAELDE